MISTVLNCMKGKPSMEIKQHFEAFFLHFIEHNCIRIDLFLDQLLTLVLKDFKSGAFLF